MSMRERIALALRVWYDIGFDGMPLTTDFARGADAVLAEVKAAGYVIVPEEPTMAMLDVGNTVTMNAGHVWMPSDGIDISGPECALECWEAMIRAAREGK